MPASNVRRLVARAAAASGVLVAIPTVVAAGITTAAPAFANDANPVTCVYQLNQWIGGFTAEVYITNRGPAINGWTVRWTFDSPTTVTSVWTAHLSQSGSAVTATNMPWNSSIPTDKTTSFGWNALAPSTAVPTDLSVNGQPC